MIQPLKYMQNTLLLYRWLNTAAYGLNMVQKENCDAEEITELIV